MGRFIRRLGVGCLTLVGFGALAIIAIGIFAAIGSSSGSGSSPKPQIGVVGKPTRVPDNLDVTLTGYTLTRGNSFYTPKTGNEYVITHWRFRNYRTENTDVADFGFKVQSQGVITNPEFASGLTGNELGSSGTTLAPGAAVKRDIVFQIARGDSSAKIIYQPDSSDDTRKVTWKVRG